MARQMAFLELAYARHDALSMSKDLEMTEEKVECTSPMPI